MRNSQEAKTNTFLLVAERWWNVKKASVTEDYADDIWRSHERDVFSAIGDIVSFPHNRSDYLEQRRSMMQWWADFVNKADSRSIVENRKREFKLMV